MGESLHDDVGARYCDKLQVEATVLGGRSVIIEVKTREYERVE